MNKKAPQTPSATWQESCNAATRLLSLVMADLDLEFGKGYAEKHPGVVNGLMLAAALGFQAASLNPGALFYGGDIESVLAGMAGSLSEIADALESIADKGQS